MIRHEHIWRAVDQLAAEHGVSPSALARNAGLDPTSFNPSKRRHHAVGKLRWLSTESVAKLLNATGGSMSGFGGLVDEAALIKPTGPAPDALSQAARYRAKAEKARAEARAVNAPEARQALSEIAALYERLAR